MTYMPPAPPPIPQQYINPKGKKFSYGTKLLLIGCVACVLMIGALAVWIMAYDRDSKSENVAHNIAEEWGSALQIGNMTLRLDSLCLAPDNYECSVQVNAKTLHRGIYEAEVFSAQININGHFFIPRHTTDSTLTVCVSISPQNIYDLQPLYINGQPYFWNKTANNIYATIPLHKYSPNDSLSISTAISANGAEKLSVYPSGKRSVITIGGDAGNPSFGGNSLPQTRTVTKKYFRAQWVSYNDSTTEIENVYTSFLVGVDRYQKVLRSIKYAFIIILLTFLSVFFAETFTHHPIPILNYMLIGAALILFYSLLLSLTEHMSFGAAYLISTIMTVGLITTYMWGMLHSARVGLIIGLILTVIYTGCYILLCVSTYALLMGSLMLFAALATMMYASLKIKL
jgi:inner membrane creD family protein